MNINWNSDDSYLLANSRMDENQRLFFEKGLLSIDFPSHVWIATSGSSSTFQKWAALSKKGLLASAKAVNEHLCSDETDRWLHALPDFHVGGLGIRVRAYLSGAAVIDFKEKWNPFGFHETAHREKITLSAMVPTQLYDLVENGLSAPPSLKAVIVGGAALNEMLYAKAKQLGWHPLPSYGLTEICSQAATAPLDSLNNSIFPDLKILSHVACRVDEGGYLHLSSEALLTAYAWFEEEIPRIEDPKINGWFRTEDLAKIDGKTLRFIGRSSDFVKIGGESVNIARLNSILEKIRQEKRLGGDQAVFALPDPRLGHVLHLAHAGMARGELDILLRAYEMKTLPFERIREIHEVEAIPRSSLNKLQRALLMKKFSSL